MGDALVVGAGAIGRGFLPWCLAPEFRLTFVDASSALIQGLRKRSGFHTWMSIDGTLQPRFVGSAQFLLVEDLNQIDLESMDVCFVSVGPRNVEKLPPQLGQLRCPVYSLENDPNTVQRVRELLGIERVYFGIPDVISSSSASPVNLASDPWAIHTEQGTLYLESPADPTDENVRGLDAVWCDKDEIARQWEAKLYLHNSPHAIAAYLGSAFGYEYLHEGMADLRIRKIVEGSLDEILQALIIDSKRHPDELTRLKQYAEKELLRFSNSQLWDPIKRVARQPLRKLRRFPDGRLTGVAELCLNRGIMPTNVLEGIAAALCYKDASDDDFPTLQLLQAYGIEQFLWHFAGIEPNGVLSSLISKSYLRMSP